MSVNKNIIQNIGSNSFGVVVTLFNQVLMIPFFLSYWGVDRYSDWIVLTSISSFFTMTDVGINSVTANQFTIEYARGKKMKCNSLLSNNYLILSILTIISFLVILTYVGLCDVNSNFNIHATDESVTKKVLVILVLNIFFKMFSGSLNTIYRAVSLFSKSIIIDNLGRICETIILLIGIIFDFGLTEIVSFMMLPNIVIFIYKYFNTKRYIKYKISLKNINLKLLQKMLIPSVGFLSFPFGNAIISQGFSLIVNLFLGAPVLVLFNTTRTLVNFIKQLVNIVSSAIWPEFSIAFGKMDFQKMKDLHRLSIGLSTLICIICSFLIMLFGKYIFIVWTNNKVTFNLGLMLSFVIVLINNTFWYTSSMCLMATNKHVKLGVYYLLLSVLSIGALYFFLNFQHSIELVPLFILLVDTVLVSFVIKRVLVLTKDSLSEFTFGIFQLYKNYYTRYLKKII